MENKSSCPTCRYYTFYFIYILYVILIYVLRRTPAYAESIHPNRIVSGIIEQLPIHWYVQRTYILSLDVKKITLEQ